jgi:hypothetical protein
MTICWIRTGTNFSTSVRSLTTQRVILIIFSKVSTVIRKYKVAVPAATESEAYLEELSQGLDNIKLTEWKEQMDKAQRERISRRDAMDIFDTNLDKGLAPFTPESPSCPNIPIAPTCAEKQLELFEKESRNPHLRGCAAWIAHGLDIHQSQLSSKVSCLNIN